LEQAKFAGYFGLNSCYFPLELDKEKQVNLSLLAFCQLPVRRAWNAIEAWLYSI
jgi:hypothetical protein